MELIKAIEILTRMSQSTNVASREECIEAIKLGIDALNRERKHRERLRLTKPELLPGETAPE